MPAKNRPNTLIAKARVGQTVVLKGGTKKKRKYNNEKAVIQEVPTRGCWMTVQIGNKGAPASLKWHKTSFRPVDRPKTDPLTMLNDETCMKIFSFLFGECPKDKDANEQTLWLRSVAVPRFQGIHPLLSVSSLWKGTFERIIPTAIGPVAVELYTVNWVSCLVRWLCRIKGIQLSSLFVSYVELADIPYITKLIANCNTQNLSVLELSINKERKESSSWCKFSLDADRVVALVDPRDEANEHARELQARVHVTELKTLHTLIAQECPRLLQLEVAMTFPMYSTDYSNYISEALFSMPSIQVLEISLGYHGPYSNDEEPTIDSTVITKLVQNLLGLKTLKLKSANSPGLYMRRFHIESNSLEHIDVTGLGKRTLASCNCPNLKTYRCTGNFFGNGTMPLLSQSQFDNLTEEEDLVVPAGEYEFPHFEVPDTCQMTLDGFDELDTFQRYNRRAREVANAAFQAF